MECHHHHWGCAFPHVLQSDPQGADEAKIDDLIRPHDRRTSIHGASDPNGERICGRQLDHRFCNGNCHDSRPSRVENTGRRDPWHCEWMSEFDPFSRSNSRGAGSFRGRAFTIYDSRPVCHYFLNSRMPSYHFRKLSSPKDSRVAGQYRPRRGHSGDPVLGLAMGLDGYSTGRSFDSVCKACGGLSSIVDSYFQSSCGIASSCFTLDPFRPGNYRQDSSLHTQEISSQNKALKITEVGTSDSTGQLRTATRPSRQACCT